MAMLQLTVCVIACVLFALITCCSATNTIAVEFQRQEGVTRGFLTIQAKQSLNTEPGYAWCLRAKLRIWNNQRIISFRNSTGTQVSII